MKNVFKNITLIAGLMVIAPSMANPKTSIFEKFVRYGKLAAKTVAWTSPVIPILQPLFTNKSIEAQTKNVRDNILITGGTGAATAIVTHLITKRNPFSAGWSFITALISGGLIYERHTGNENLKAGYDSLKSSSINTYAQNSFTQFKRWWNNPV